MQPFGQSLRNTVVLLYLLVIDMNIFFLFRCSLIGVCNITNKSYQIINKILIIRDALIKIKETIFFIELLYYLDIDIKIK